VALSARGDLATYPQVAFDVQGDATAVWDELPKSAEVYYGVRTSSRPAVSGVWEPSELLSPAGLYAGTPKIATDPAGASVMVWEQGGEYLSSAPKPRYPEWVEASFRSSPISSWHPALQISPVGAEADNVVVGIDAGGTAVASWVASTGSRCSSVETDTGNAGSDSWAAPVEVAESCTHEIVWPGLAVDSRGDALVAWMVLEGGAPLSRKGVTEAVEVASEPVGGGWSRPVRLGTAWGPGGQWVAAFEFPGPAVALDAAGDAVIVWQGKGKGETFPEADIKLASAPRWQKPVRIANTTASLPAVAIDARGDATAVWQGPDGIVQAASESLTARAWSVPKTLFGTSGYRAEPQISVNARGDAIAVSDANGVQASVRRGSHGSWQRAVKLGTGGVPQVAIDALSNAIVVWQEPTGRRGIVIEAARYTVRERQRDRRT